MANIEAGPAADAALIIGRNCPVAFSGPCIYRADLDAGGVVTRLADNGNVMIGIFKGMDLDTRMLGAANTMMRHGTGYLTQMASRAPGGINENMVVPFFQNSSCEILNVHYSEQF